MPIILDDDATTLDLDLWVEAAKLGKVGVEMDTEGSWTVTISKSNPSGYAFRAFGHGESVMQALGAAIKTWREATWPA